MSTDKTTRDKDNALANLAQVAAEAFGSIKDARWRIGHAILDAGKHGWALEAMYRRLNEMDMDWRDVVGRKMTRDLVRDLRDAASNVPECAIIDPQGKRQPITRELVDSLDLSPELVAQATAGDIIKVSELSKAIHKVQAGVTPKQATAGIRRKIDPQPETAKPERETAQAAYDRALAKRDKAQAALDNANAELLAAKRRLDQVNESLLSLTAIEEAVPATIAETPKADKPKTTKPRKPTNAAQRAAVAR